MRTYGQRPDRQKQGQPFQCQDQGMDDAKHLEAPTVQRYARFLRHAACRNANHSIHRACRWFRQVHSWTRPNSALEESALSSDANPSLTPVETARSGGPQNSPKAQSACRFLARAASHRAPYLFHLSERSTALIAAARWSMPPAWSCKSLKSERKASRQR